MLSALLALVIFLIVVGFLVYVVGLAPIDATVKQIIKAVIILVLCVGVIWWIAAFFGAAPSWGPGFGHR